MGLHAITYSKPAANPLGSYGPLYARPAATASRRAVATAKRDSKTVSEELAAEKRRLDLERSSWHDATFGNGTPIEIKRTMLEYVADADAATASLVTGRSTDLTGGYTAGRKS